MNRQKLEELYSTHYVGRKAGLSLEAREKFRML